MIWLSAIVISLHSFLFGYVMSSLGPCLKEHATGSILNDIPMDAFHQQLATGATVFGAILGAMYASNPASKYGVKRVLFIINWNWVIGGLLCLFSNFWTLAIGRFVLGCGVGISSCTAPVLLSEIAPTEKRGTVTGIHQLQCTIGILSSGITAYGFVTYLEHGWRYVLGLPIAIGVIILLLESFVPNSPLWLVRHGRVDEARTTISKLRFGVDVCQVSADPVSSLNTIDSSLHQSASFSSSVPSDTHLMEREQQQILVEDLVHQLQQDDERERAANAAPVNWTDVFANKKAIALGLAVMFFQPMSGINTIIFYSTKIFGFAGVKEDILATISVGVVNVIMTVVSMYAVEKSGRKVLLVGGTAVCSLALFVLAATLSYLDDNAELQGNLAVGFTLLYVMAFAVGLGAVSWVVLSEIVPSRIRNKAYSLFVMEAWVFNFIIAMLTLTAINGLGGGDSDAEQKAGVAKLFIIFGAICAVGTTFFAVFLPETKGLSEGAIQDILYSRAPLTDREALLKSTSSSGRILRVDHESDEDLFLSDLEMAADFGARERRGSSLNNIALSGLSLE